MKAAKPAVKKTVQRRCETCRYYKEGDPAPINHGNAGICTVMLQRNTTLYGHGAEVGPFWTIGMVHRVIGWQGESCQTWAAKKGTKDK